MLFGRNETPEFHQLVKSLVLDPIRIWQSPLIEHAFERTIPVETSLDEPCLKRVSRDRLRNSSLHRFTFLDTLPEIDLELWVLF